MSAPVVENATSMGDAMGAPRAEIVPPSVAVEQVVAAAPTARLTSPLVLRARTVHVESTKNSAPVPGCTASASGVRLALNQGCQGAPTAAPATVEGAPVPASTCSVPELIVKARIMFSKFSAI